MMWWSGSGGPGWGGWLVMSLSIVAFWGLVTWGIVALVRWTRHPSPGSGSPGPPETAEQILARRFANGDISEEEFRSRLEALQAGHAVRA
jgi:putative membrane protein